MDTPRDAVEDGGAPVDAPQDTVEVDAPPRDTFVGFDVGQPPLPTCEGLVEASPALDVSCGDPALVEPVESTNRFGYALAFGDEELFVSAPGFASRFDQGGVAVYGAVDDRYRLTQWLFVGGIGWSMAQRGTRLLVGAPQDSLDDDESLDRVGFVVEYERQACGWVRKGVIDSPATGAAREGDRFGGSITLHDDFALIGSDRTEGPANVYYSMQYAEDAWVLTDTLSCGTQAAQQHRLHSTISADGQTVLLRNDEDGVLCVFQRAEADGLLWELASTTTLDRSVVFQGANVSISEGLVFVGSSGLRFMNTPALEAGAVRVFTLTAGGLTELPDLIIREPVPTVRHKFGSAVHAECDPITRECALWVVAQSGREDGDEKGVLWRVVWHRIDGVRSIERLPSCAVGTRGDIGRQAVFRGNEAFVSLPEYGQAWRVVD